MTNNCPDCDSLQRQLDQTQRELAEVKKELAIARHTLGKIFGFCDTVAGNNATEMKGRVAGGRWEYLKGELGVANKVLEIMGQHAYGIKNKGKSKTTFKAFSGIFRGLKW